MQVKDIFYLHKPKYPKIFVFPLISNRNGELKLKSVANEFELDSEVPPYDHPYSGFFFNKNIFFNKLHYKNNLKIFHTYISNILNNKYKSKYQMTIYLVF